MIDPFPSRLNKVIPRLTSADLLQNQGIGNEIGFWIFDYPAEREMEMRSFLEETVLPHLEKRQPAIRFAVVNLFQTVIGLLEERKLYEKTLEKQRQKGSTHSLAALRSVLKEDKLAQYIATQVDLDVIDILLITGVGAAYPMLRSHTLLNALQPVMRQTPLVMFYPGRYDGFSLRLFDTLSDDHYYRAFRLVD